MQSETRVTSSAFSSAHVQNVDRIAAIRQEMEYLNTIGKRFVAALDRFQVHRALLAALKDLYSFSACAILLKGDPLKGKAFDLSVIPCYPLSQPFLEAMMQRIANAASVIDFPKLTAEELAAASDLDAPDELSSVQEQNGIGGTELGSCLNIPLTVENRIVGMLSLFDEGVGTFDSELLKLTTMIADYAAVALENVRLRERETALWREAEMERQRLKLILSSMAEGLLITDEQGAMTMLNASARQLLAQAHMSVDEDMSLMALSGDVDWISRLAEIVERALRGETVLNQELIAGEDSETVPLTLSLSAAPLHDASDGTGQPIGVVAVLNDVTANKQIEKLKDEFVSVVSHELRTPLTAIKGYTQHVLRRIERRLRKAKQEQARAGVSSPLAEEYDIHSLRIVQSQAEHLERLVNDLLDLSRVQWGKLHLRNETFYLADVLADAVRSAQVSTEQHTISFELLVEDTKIVADKARISQVIGNILDNAVKYSPNGGRITVSLKDGDGEYLIKIIDEGIGIGAEYLEHIFERFYRVRNMASRQYAGIGLGLYVTKAIVEGHGGQIWVTNNDGLGCTFSLTLPREAHNNA